MTFFTLSDIRIYKRKNAAVPLLTDFKNYGRLPVKKNIMTYIMSTE